MATATCNLVILSRTNELFAETENTFAPFGSFSVAKAGEILAVHGGGEVRVKFNTSDKYAAEDVAKFGKRLAKLAEVSGYAASEFDPMVVRGIVVPNVMVATLRRAS